MGGTEVRFLFIAGISFYSRICVANCKTLHLLFLSEYWNLVLYRGSFKVINALTGSCKAISIHATQTDMT